MLGTRKEDNGRIYSAGTGLATVCTAQFFYRFTFKLTLKQACFTFQGTALNMPLTHKLPRPFSQGLRAVFRGILRSSTTWAFAAVPSCQSRAIARLSRESCFWQKPEPGRTWQGATIAVVKFGHPLYPPTVQKQRN